MAETSLATIDVPAIRPPGVTKRQWRLAALLPRCETAAEALRQAGYSANSIDRNGRPLVGTVGVRRATEALAAQQADRARGLIGAGKTALAAVDADVKELEPRDRLAFGLKAYELGHQLGENIEQHGDGDAWKRRLRRACLMMERLTEARLDTTRCSAFASRNRATRKLARGY